MFGMANEMTDIKNAKRFDFITEARRVKRMRFGNSKSIEIIKVPKELTSEEINEDAARYAAHLTNI